MGTVGKMQHDLTNRGLVMVQLHARDIKPRLLAALCRKYGKMIKAARRLAMNMLQQPRRRLLLQPLAVALPCLREADAGRMLWRGELLLMQRIDRLRHRLIPGQLDGHGLFLAKRQQDIFLHSQPIDYGPQS